MIIPFRKGIPHEYNEIHVIDIGDKKCSFRDSSFTLSGDIRIVHPYVDYDIGFNKSFNFKERLLLDVTANLGEEKNFIAEISTSLNGAEYWRKSFFSY